ncbi:hypothetical protein CapIbe_007005 [Capra ibex]
MESRGARRAPPLPRWPPPFRPPTTTQPLAEEVMSQAPCERIATHAAAWREGAGVLRQSRRRGAAAGEEQPLPPRTGPLGRRRREDGGRPQCCRQERGDLEDQKAHQELGGGPRQWHKHDIVDHSSQRPDFTILGAITSVQQRLKLYNKVPPNGLVVYCGTIVTEEGKEKKVNIDFEPFKPINTSLYLCDNKFHTEALTALLSDDSKFGFIVIDGSGALFGTLQGNTREVLHKFTVDLPKKHGRGGQSALRFARLRMEKRHNYVRKVAETAVQLFISGDKVNVAGLVLAGSADFKTELSQSDMFDQRLQSKVLKLVDISYGGENGFNQAIELSTEVLSNVKFIQEKKLIGRYFDEISQDTGKYCFGVEDTLKALEMGAVEILIVYENLDIMRYVLHCQGTEEEKILYLTPEQEKDKSHFTDKETGQEHELIESMPLLEWFANNYKKFGATLEIVTDKSQEGSQFVKGFGGIGGILRYRVDFQGMEYQGGDDEFFDLDDY